MSAALEMVPPVVPATVSLPLRALSRSAKAALSFVSKDKARPVLTSALATVADGAFLLVGTDGASLVETRIPWTGPGTMYQPIPRTILETLARVKIPKKEGPTATVSEGRVAWPGGAVDWIPEPDYTFPDYERVIPSQTDDAGSGEDPRRPVSIGFSPSLLARLEHLENWNAGMRVQWPADAHAPLRADAKADDGCSITAIVMPMRI